MINFSRRALLALALTTSFSGIATTPVDESAKANVFFDRVFDEGVARSPMHEAFLGIRKDTDKWDDFSEQRQLDDLARTVQQLNELRRSIAFDRLDDQTKLSYRLFVFRAEREIEGWRWRHHGYVFTQMQGMHQDAPAFLINFHPVASEADAKAYIARLRGMAPMFAQLESSARAGQAIGVLPPKFVFPLLIDASRQVIRGEPFDGEGQSALWADFSAKVEGLTKLAPAKKKALLDAGRAALLQSVKPAYEQLIAMFEAQQKLATDDDGAWKLPDGEAYYAWRLRQSTTSHLSADEIHVLGLSEVARIHAAVDEIRQRVGFQGGLKAFLAYMRDDPQFVYPQTEAGKAAYIERATQIIEDMKRRLPEFFGVLPKAALVVKKVEPFREQGSAGAFYNAPAPDGSRPGTYYVNTVDMRGLPIWEMETLAHHEAIPGHHMQIAIAQELKGLPKFRRFSNYNAYGEGWALYSEAFPKEFGFYSDPYQDFGRLSDELLRAVRLVVDTGIHARRWTREQVVAYMEANTAGSERDNFTESNRYVVWPGQATGYKVGMLKIMELQERARAKLGERFDLRAFHDVVLKNGALPLDLLEQIVDDWISRQLPH